MIYQDYAMYRFALSGCSEQYQHFLEIYTQVPGGNMLLAKEFSQYPQVTRDVLEETIDIIISFAERSQE